MSLAQDQKSNSGSALSGRSALLDQIASNHFFQSPTTEQKNGLICFRHLLRDQGLSLLARCINWSEDESVLVREVFRGDVQLDIDSTLEILGVEKVHNDVRACAVRQLEMIDDNTLQFYLLGLVQALRFHGFPSALYEFLKNRAVLNMCLANFLYWYLNAEALEETSDVYSQARDNFMNVLLESSPLYHQMILNQVDLVEKLVQLNKLILASRRYHDRLKLLQSALDVKGELQSLRRFLPTRIPVRPQMVVQGVASDNILLIKNALSPILVHFIPEHSSSTSLADVSPSASLLSYQVVSQMDDMRSDQLITSLFSFIDDLWKKHQLDLQLTSYCVLVTSSEHAFIEHTAQSMSLLDVCSKHGSIVKFFEFHFSKPRLRSQAFQVFVRSYAGYSVLMYIFGIGDRHLDNFYLTESGRLFIMDFGFIFGRDPFPFPQPWKFERRIFEAFGSAESEAFNRYRHFCCLAFNLLRAHSRIVLSMILLMRQSKIPHLTDNFEATFRQLEERFRLDLNDDEANAHLNSLIDGAVSKLFPTIKNFSALPAKFWRTDA